MKITITYLFLIISTLTFAQEETKVQSTGGENTLKNAIYISAGSLLLLQYNSSVDLNYNLRIGHTDKGFFKNYYLNLKTGFYRINSLSWSSRGIGSGLGFIGLSGTKNDHFEVDLGVILNIETEIINENNLKQTYVIPDLSIGYRYQKKKCSYVSRWNWFSSACSCWFRL